MGVCVCVHVLFFNLFASWRHGGAAAPSRLRRSTAAGAAEPSTRKRRYKKAEAEDYVLRRSELRTKTFFGRPKMFERPKNIFSRPTHLLDVQKMFWAFKKLFGCPKTVVGRRGKKAEAEDYVL